MNLQELGGDQYVPQFSNKWMDVLLQEIIFIHAWCRLYICPFDITQHPFLYFLSSSSCLPLRWTSYLVLCYPLCLSATQTLLTTLTLEETVYCRVMSWIIWQILSIQHKRNICSRIVHNRIAENKNEAHYTPPVVSCKS